jgi:branched-chain amino acid transport system permease protein
MPPRRSDPIRSEDEMAFATREEAEWEVFRRRWLAATGENLNLSLRD